ncbi:MAG TPA: hypothetical protein VEO00_01460, partial [Actinomycetota bacterium]|nr:hypothetical protein [Actinomycetota bacterium]
MSQVTVGTVPVRLPRRTLVREQMLVTGAQLVAGAGNVVFALVMARVLAPAAFTDLAAFLVCYLLLHLPAAGLGAGGALAGAGAGALRRRALGAGIAGGLVLAAVSPALASLLRLPLALPLLLAAAAPAAAALALERGRLYGTGRHPQAALTLVLEPVSRLVAGIALARVAGAPGAAAGVVVGGYLALLATRTAGQAPVVTVPARTGAAVAAFFLLAVVQNQDLLLAARVLPEVDAARFAALSTLGGVAAFATATIPVVLLPRASDQPHALRVALAVAAALGGAAVLAFTVAAGPLTDLVFGGRYGAIAPLAAPYVLGMALLGVTRVLAADRIARGTGTTVVVATAIAAIVQAGLIVRFGTSVAAVAAVTVATTAGLAATLAVATVVRLPAPSRTVADVASWLRERAVLAVTAAAAAGLALRLLVTRGLWVDEAISVKQAGLPFGTMLDRLAAGDVHPPLHASLLWVTVRVFGDGEFAVRLPSLVAGV